MILKRILKVCGVVSLVCLLTVLCCLPFVNFKDNKTVANAVELQPMDSVVNSFSSSNFPFLVSSFNVSSWSPSTSNVVTTRYIPFRFTFDSDNLSIYYYDDVALENRNRSYSLVADGNWYNNSFLFSLASTEYIFTSYRCGVGFNFNVVRVLIGSDSGYRGNMDFASSFIEFYDSNNVGLRILFGFAPMYGGYNYGLWNSLTDRTYYFISDITDNDYYNAGVDYGKQLGRDEVWQSRYDDGFGAGRIVGDGEGYIRGVNDANTYTFFNLFGALFDVPVRIVTGLLNFDFLGVNLFNFATGILTFIIILKIIGYIKGR